MKEIFFPKLIKSFLENVNYQIDEVGCTSAQVLIFDDYVLKISNIDDESNNEYKMMKWLKGKLPVPEVIEHCREQGKDYLLMTRVKGKMACAEEYLETPEKTVRLLAQGLKHLWNVDIKDCPIINNLDYKLHLAKLRVEQGLVDIENAEPATFGPEGFSDPLALYEYLEKYRPQEELCLIHGDYCLPNVFFADEGISGFIDLGRSGIGDKWLDIAICVRSILHNFSTEKYVDLLFRELGMEKDNEKIRYYILLDELF